MMKAVPVLAALACAFVLPAMGAPATAKPQTCVEILSARYDTLTLEDLAWLRAAMTSEHVSVGAKTGSHLADLYKALAENGVMRVDHDAAAAKDKEGGPDGAMYDWAEGGRADCGRFFYGR